VPTLFAGTASADVRHHQVERQHVGRLLRDLIEHARSVGDRADLVALQLPRARQRLARGAIVTCGKTWVSSSSDPARSCDAE
jgi:hypothetical protein